MVGRQNGDIAHTLHLRDVAMATIFWLSTYGAHNDATFNGKENPFPAIGDAAYRKHVGGGPSHGNRQHARKL